MGRTTLSRRQVVGFLVSGMGMTVLGACSQGTGLQASTPPDTVGTPGRTLVSASTPEASTDAQAAASARPGGTLRFVLTQDPSTLEVQELLGNNTEAIWPVYDRLVSYDDKLVPRPQLAESWDLSSDDKQIRMNLRHGVQWHSGREFTSDDVKYSVLRVRDRKVGAGTFANQSSWFTEIDTPDKYTIILISDQPRPLVFDFLNYFNIVDQATMEAPDAKSKAMGTGPFSFVEWVQGDHITLLKNKNYWQSGRPYLDGIHIGIVRDMQSAVAQLEAGSLDAVKNAGLPDFIRLRSDPKYQGIVHSTSGLYYVIGLNTLHPPLDNKAVRQALNYAIDRKRFIDTVRQGVGQSFALPWQPGSPAFDAGRAAAYAFDLDKARSLLTQSNTRGFDMDLVLTPTDDGQSMAQIYQADLARIGVNLNIKAMESAAWLDQVNNRKYVGAYWSGATRSNLLPGTMLSSSQVWDPQNNNSGYKTDQYSQLVSAAGTEPDPARQQQIYTQLNDLLLDESFGMFVSSAPPTMLTTSGLHDVQPVSIGGFGFTQAWLSD
jgi:peptide/nickel transport system substrate-binding protein